MRVDTTHAKSSLIVYIDKQNKAHWAFLVAFLGGSRTGMPAVPTYILDAQSFAVYAEWNDLQTLENVTGGDAGAILNWVNYPMMVQQAIIRH